MVSRITLGVRGLPEYLENGIKSGSTLSREEKDSRLHIDGSIDALKDSIEFCQSKGWKNSYYHLTLSFKHEEWEKLEKANNAQDVVQRYLQLMFPNHSLDEICYHAEAHIPKIKYEPFVSRGKNDPRVGTEGDMMERHPHIHIGVSLQNMQYSRQIAAGGILGKSNKKDSELFKKTCDEIVSAEFDLVDAVARKGKEKIMRKSYEENFKIWKHFEHAAKQRTKGKELESTFDPSKDFVEMVFEDLPKAVEPIKKEPEKETSLKDVAAARLKNLSQIYNPSELEKKIDSEVFKRLRETDVNKLIPYIREYFIVPSTHIRKSEEGNKIELLRTNSGKWVKFSVVDFFTQEMKLGKDEAVKLATIFSSLEAAGVGMDAFVDSKGRKLNIANVAIDNLGWKFENIPQVKLSVSRDLVSEVDEERKKKIKEKNPNKPVYSAVKDYKPEYNTLLDWAKELDDKKMAGFSIANFKGGYRNNHNIESLNPVIVLDVDSKEKQYEITIDEMRKKLEALNISSLILPTASHSEKLHRFRVLIPTQKAFDTKGKPHTEWEEDYKSYVDRFIDLLKLDPVKIDKTLDAARYKPAQFYYGSPSHVTATFSKGVVFDNSKILEEISKERERINADVQLKNQEKDYGIAKNEVELYAKKLEEDLKLSDGVDNDKALSRTVISNINSTIDILAAAKLRYPNAKIIKEGRYEILHTGDTGRDGNRNLLAKYGVFNFATRKIRTSYDFLKEYLESVNSKIKEFNYGYMVPTDRKEKLKNFLISSPVVSKVSEQPLEFRKIDTRNGNNYAKLVQHFFKEQYPKICLPNLKGIVKNLMHYMKNINDSTGLENFKQHYGGLKIVDLHNGRIGYLNNISLKELKENGLSDEWTNPPKPLENKIKTRQISQKSPSKDEMNF